MNKINAPLYESVTVALTEEIYKKLIKIAQKQERTRTFIIRRALEKYLAEYKIE